MFKSNNKTKTLNFPHVLRIEPSAKCNLMCSHCPTGTIELGRDLMNEITFENILKNLLDIKNLIKVIVLYHGGEPLLNKNFFSYVERIKKIKKNFFIKTVSNGTALTKSNINKIFSSGLDAIEFSLDGISENESQYVRINSDVKKIITNIKNLINEKYIRKSNLDITISSTQFLRKKLDNIEEIPELKTPNWLKKLFSDKVNYKLGYAMRWPHMDVKNNYDLMFTSGEDKNKCDNVISTITVRSDGNIVPCCYDLTSQIVLGNINTKSLKEIWNSKKFFELRESIEKKQFISICKNCSNVRPPVYLIPRWDIKNV